MTTVALLKNLNFSNFHCVDDYEIFVQILQKIVNEFIHY